MLISRNNLFQKLLKRRYFQTLKLPFCFKGNDPYTFPVNTFTSLIFYHCQGKSLADVRTQIDQLKGSMAMKQAEMGTELIDHLSPEEKDLLSRLNPEIADLKEKLIACRTDRIEVGNLSFSFFS